MADASQAMTAMGGVTKAYGSYEAGKYNAAADRYNANLATLQANQSIQAGALEKSKQDERLAQAEAITRADFAAGGTVVNAGTNRSALATESNLSAMEKTLIDINARRRAFGYQVASSNFSDQAMLARRKGNQDALGTLLDTTANLEKQESRSRSTEDENNAIAHPYDEFHG